MTGNLLFFTVLALNVHLQMVLTLILRITLITNETIYRICYLISVKFGVWSENEFPEGGDLDFSCPLEFGHIQDTFLS